MNDDSDTAAVNRADLLITSKSVILIKGKNVSETICELAACGILCN
jgi:hypothetical protein